MLGTNLSERIRRLEQAGDQHGAARLHRVLSQMLFLRKKVEEEMLVVSPENSAELVQLRESLK